MCVDRENRDRLAEAINRYLDEEIAAFEFDEEIFDIAAESHDPTVDIVVHTLWFHYDDLKDHKVNLCKAEWDYFQRLVLLLKSEAHLEIESRKAWTPRQALAALALATFVYCFFQLGWGWHLIWVTAPLGGVSMLLHRWRDLSMPTPSKRWAALTPFVSVAQMLAIRRRVTGFAKRRYPGDLEDRQIRGPIEEWVNMLPAGALWLALSPLVLFQQALPEEEGEHVVVPA